MPDTTTDTSTSAQPRARRLTAFAAIVAGVAFAAPVATVSANSAAETARPAVTAPGVEVLRLQCAVAPGQPGPEATRVRVGCRWSQPSAARVLTLWRSVDGGPRERVASFTNRFPSSYRDVVPASANRVVYAVIATDGAGNIVARSRPDGVVIPG